MSQAEDLLNSLTETVIDHTHAVPDSDTYFLIDPYTRQIENTNYQKTVLMRGDHNSERFTFEVPRYVDGHDMSLCNRVLVHFDNVGEGTNEYGESVINAYSDVAYMDDLRINPDKPETVISSWLIRREATQIVGVLSFSIQYQCVEDGEVTYEWNTDSYDDIEIRKSKNNGEAAVIKYTNVLEQWRSQIFGAGDSVMSNITTEGANQVTAVQNESATQQAAIELKGSETLASIPDDYTEVYNMATEAVRTKADGIVCEAEGEAITVADASDDYIRGLNLYGKSTQFTTTGKNLWNGEYTNFAFGASSQSNNKLAIFQSDIYKSIVIPVTPGKVYSVSRGADIWGRLYVGFTKEYPEIFDVVVFPDGQSGELVLGDYNYGTALTVPAVTVPAECQYMVVYLTNDIMTYDVTKTWYQIEEGEEATDYEPYTGGMPSPNPEYPQEIVSIENPTVAVCGKNLLNIHVPPAATLAAEVEVDGESVTVSSTDDAILTRAVYKLDYPKNTPLTISFDATVLEVPSMNAGTTVRLRKGNKSTGIVMLDLTQIGVKKHYEITTDPLTEDGFELWLYLRTLSEASGFISVRFENIQVEVGAAATEYEPYKTAQILNSQYALNALGEIKDELSYDFATNTWHIIRRVGDVTLDGTKTYKINSYNLSTEGAYIFEYYPGNLPNKETNYRAISDKLIYSMWGSILNVPRVPRVSAVASRIMVYLPDQTITTIEDFTTYVAENPIRVLYELAEPVVTPLTAEEIETYKSLRTNYPNTTILNNAGAMMKVKYNADTKLYVNNAAVNGAVSVVEEVLNDTY